MHLHATLSQTPKTILTYRIQWSTHTRGGSITLLSYSETTSITANIAIYIMGYQTLKFNINYLYSWVQAINLTEVTKNI
jgi:hypothetical protein